MKYKSLFIGVIAVGATASAQIMPTEDKTVNRTFPEEPGFKNDTEYKRKFEDMRKQLEALQQNQTSAQQTLQAAGGGTVATPTPNQQSAQINQKELNSQYNIGMSRISQHKKTNKSSQSITKKSAWVPSSIEGDSDSDLIYAEKYTDNYAADSMVNPASSAKVFAVSESAQLASDDSMTVLPAGSFVRAKVVSGVEANTLEPYPVLLQLMYGFTGPNKTKIDLSNCFIIAKARANLSTERVIMETETLSCVRENGEHFKTVARGYTAGEDSTFGSTGTFISKQGQVLLAAVLANIAKNAGEAIALAQQSTSIAGADRAATATNVTGSKGAFIAGKSMVDASSMIAEWYLNYAKQLIPSIAIGSGQEVHVVMLETIHVPTLKE